MTISLLIVLFLVGATGTVVGLLAMILTALSDDGRDTDDDAEVARISGAFHIVPVPARHALGVALGTEAQRARWACETCEMPAVTG